MCQLSLSSNEWVTLESKESYFCKKDQNLTFARKIKIKKVSIKSLCVLHSAEFRFLIVWISSTEAKKVSSGIRSLKRHLEVERRFNENIIWILSCKPPATLTLTRSCNAYAVLYVHTAYTFVQDDSLHQRKLNIFEVWQFPYFNYLCSIYSITIMVSCESWLFDF